MTTIIFSHGKESGPLGRKITRLSEVAQSHGCETFSVDYTSTLNPDERVQLLARHLVEQKDNFIFVGSSMGGYVSTVYAMRNPPTAMYLMAPAFYIPGYAIQKLHSNCYTEIVHGWQDEVIPINHSIQFAKENNCLLHALPGNHALSNALVDVSRLFDLFISKVLESQNN